MTLGVALCVRSALGSSVISTTPYVMTLAGENGVAPGWSIGGYTYVMNFLLVGLQIVVLRRRFQAVQLGGCVVLAIGISFEIRCGSVTMPGEGLPVAISRATEIPFANAKIIVNVMLVAIDVGLGYLFFGRWMWEVVGIGTLLAMVLVGAMVRVVNPRLAWFDKVVCYRPGFRRYVYGLARYIMK